MKNRKKKAPTLKKDLGLLLALVLVLALVLNLVVLLPAAMNPPAKESQKKNRTRTPREKLNLPKMNQLQNYKKLVHVSTAEKKAIEEVNAQKVVTEGLGEGEEHVEEEEGLMEVLEHVTTVVGVVT
jgi:hypothetical protein